MKAIKPINRTLVFLILVLVMSLCRMHTQAANFTWDGGGGDNNWLSAGNWNPDGAPPNDGTASLIFTGTLQTSTNNNFSGLTLGGATAITFNNSSTGGAFTLAGNQITLGGNITTTGTTGTPTHTISLDMILSGGRTITTVANNSIIVSGSISQSGGAQILTKTGAGILTLNGSNSFTGEMQVNQGTVNFSSIANASSSSALGAGSLIRVGNGSSIGTLVYTGSSVGSTDKQVQIGSGAATSTGGATLNSSTLASGGLTFTNANFNVADGTATVARTLTLTGLNGQTAVSEIQGIIANNSTGGGIINITKTVGNITWALTGLNTFTGQVHVQNGTLEANTLAASGSASSLGAGSGTLRLGSTTSTGILGYNGTGHSTNRALELAGTTGGGTLTASGAGAAVFTAAAVQFSNGTAAKTLTLNGSSTAANEIQSTIGNEGAFTTNLVKSGSGLWVLTGSSSYTGTTAIQGGTLRVSSIAVSGANSNLGAGSSIRFGLSSTTGTLEYTGTGETTNRTLNMVGGAGGATVLNNGTGALVFNASNVADSTTSNTKSLTLGGSNTSSNTISGSITNTTGTVNLAKQDAGLWILSGVNSYTGGNSISGGTLRVSSGSNLSTGTLSITQGTLELQNSAQTTGVTTLSTGAATGAATLALASGTSLTQAGTLTATANGGSFQSSITGGSLDMGSGAGITRTWTVGDTAGLDVDLAVSSELSFSSTGSKTWLINGGGTVEVTADNLLTGTTRIQSDSTLRVAATSDISSEVADVQQGTLDLRNNQSLALLQTGQFSIANGNASITIASAKTLTLTTPSGNSITYRADDNTANLTAISGGTLDLGSGSGMRAISVEDNPLVGGSEMTLSSTVTSSGTRGLNKTGAGTLSLTGANTFSGQVALDSGTTLVNSIAITGSASALGTGATTSAIRIGSAATSGTLHYTGSGGSTDRRIDIGLGTIASEAGGAIILSNGSGPMAFTNTQFNNPSTGTTAARSLVLGGSNTGANVISGDIVDNDTAAGGTLSVVKQDAGHWTLSGASTYTGTTLVSAGSLQVGSGGSGQTGTGNVTVSSTIYGTGSVRGQNFVMVGGALLYAGDSTASSSIGTLSFTPVSGTSSWDFQSGSSTILGIALGGTSDLLNFVGTGTSSLLFNGDLTVLPASLSPMSPAVFNLIDWAGLSITPTFHSRYLASSYSGYIIGNGDDNLGFDLPDLFGTGYAWDISNFTSNGTISLFSIVPEPSRALLLLSGLSALSLRRRRRIS